MPENFMKTYGVWDGSGNHHPLPDPTDRNAAHDKVMELNSRDIWARIHTTTGWSCRCDSYVICHGTQTAECDNCGREYTCHGQLLAKGWRDNPSNWDDDVSDMDGYEMARAGDS